MKQGNESPAAAAVRPSTARTAKGPAVHVVAVVAILVAAFFFAGVPGLAAQDRLVLGVPPYKSAVELEFMFGPLAGYISSTVGKPVLMSVAKDYDQFIRQVGGNKIDIALMGPGSYVEMVEQYGTKPLLARFEISRVPTYYGVIIVGKDSPINVLSDLKGKRIAFSDRKSTSGHIIPRHMFMNAGIALENFAEHTYMSNHDNVALGVLVGDYDAGAVRQEVFAKYEHRGLRILALTPPISESLFIASETMTRETIEAVRTGLLQLKDSPAGSIILRAIKPSLTALVPVEDQDYENLRAIMRELKDGGVVP